MTSDGYYGAFVLYLALVLGLCLLLSPTPLPGGIW